MKNKQYLEQIIRGYLAEASVSIIAKAIIAPEKIRSAAKKVGAEEAFIAKLIVRGRNMPSEEQIYDNLVNAVSMHSQIGKNSKFANGDYVYVLSKDTRDAKKAYVYTGFIFSEEKFDQLTTPPSTEKPDVTITSPANYHVGRSRVVRADYIIRTTAHPSDIAEFKKVNDVLNATNKSAETASPTIDVTTNEPTTPVNTSAAKFAAGDIIPFNGAVIDTYALKNGQFVQTNFPHTSNKNETGEFVKSVTDEKTGQGYGFIKMKSSSSSDGFNHWYVKIEDLNALTDSNSINASRKFTYPYDMGNGRTAYTMSDTDPWVYSVDNGAWWTMKKAPYEAAVQNGTALPKAVNISNNAAAVSKLNAKFPEAGGAAYQGNTDNVDDTQQTDDFSQTTTDTINTSSSFQDEFNKCYEIAKDLRYVTTVNPNKYFWKYRSATNDQETEAANWFATAFNKAWAKDLKQLKNSKSSTIRTNANNINSMARAIYDAIKQGYGYRGTLPIKDTVYGRTVKFAIKWDYM